MFTKSLLYYISEIGGIDPVMTTFQICDTNADDGLKFEEIKQDDCRDVLQKMFGLTTDVLQDTFSSLDKNMDKIISREEGQVASQLLDRNSNFEWPKGTKVLVVGGTDSKTDGGATEILDLGGNPFFPNFCTKLGRFPKKFYFATGGLVGNVPMVCGGHPMDGSYFQKSCYNLQENGAWKEDEKAKLVRRKQNRISGSVVINNQLFIPEYEEVGWKGYLNFEMAVPGKETVTLKPYNKYGPFHDFKESCIVKWDANTIMLIGVKYKETLFINMGNQTVTEGPKLMTRRYKHACNEMTINGEPHIIVNGGSLYGLPLKSTEILAKSSVGKGWQKGNKFTIT